MTISLKSLFLKLLNEWSFGVFLVILLLSFNQIDLLHLLPPNTNKAIFKEILSIKVSSGELGIVLLFLLMIFKWIMKGKLPLEKYDKKYILIIVSFLASISLSAILYAKRTYPAFKEVIQYTICILIWYLIIIEFIDSEKKMWILIKFLSFAGAFIAFLGIVQFWIAYIWHINFLDFLIPLNELDSKLWFSEISHRMRTTSLFINPNAFGSFLVLIAPLSLVFWLKKRRFLLLILTLIILIGVITNYSPGNLIGLIVSIFIFSIFYSKRIQYSIYISTIFLLSALFLSYIFYPSYFSQVIDYFVKAGSFRILLWKEALRIFYEHPVLGVGLNNFWWNLSPWWIQNHSYLADSHNFILNLLLETGIIGTICFFGILCYTVYRTLPLIDNTLIGGLLAGVGGCLVTALFNSPAMFTRGTIFLFWLELHLPIIYLSLLNESKNETMGKYFQTNTNINNQPFTPSM